MSNLDHGEILLELRCFCGAKLAATRKAPNEDSAFTDVADRFWEHVDQEHPELIEVEA